MIPRKILPGESQDRSAATHGDFIDTVEVLRSTQFRTSRKSEYPHVYPGQTSVSVVNKSDYHIPMYGVLELDKAHAFVLDSDSGEYALDVPIFQQEVCFDGVAPTAIGEKACCIAQHPILKGTAAEMIVGGIIQTRVYYPNETSWGFFYARPVVGSIEALVVRAGGQFKILWSEGILGMNWALVQFEPGRLIGFELAGAHPGRGVKFQIYLGEWDWEDKKWIYDCDTTETTLPDSEITPADITQYAIDWRYGVPYPGKGATGLGVWRPWYDHGVEKSIIEVVSLDCTIPADGPTCV